jgi:hypothetical protein
MTTAAITLADTRTKLQRLHRVLREAVAHPDQVVTGALLESAEREAATILSELAEVAR